MTEYFYSFTEMNNFIKQVKGYNIVFGYNPRLKYSCVLVPKKITIRDSIFGRSQYIPRVNTEWNNFMKAREYLSKNLDNSKYDKKIKSLLDRIDNLAINIENR